MAISRITIAIVHKTVVSLFTPDSASVLSMSTWPLPSSCSPPATMTQCTHLPFKPDQKHECDLCVSVCVPSALSAGEQREADLSPLRIIAPACASEHGDEIDLCRFLFFGGVWGGGGVHVYVHNQHQTANCRQVGATVRRCFNGCTVKGGPPFPLYIHLCVCAHVHVCVCVHALASSVSGVRDLMQARGQPAHPEP